MTKRITGTTIKRGTSKKMRTKKLTKLAIRKVTGTIHKTIDNKRGRDSSKPLQARAPHPDKSRFSGMWPALPKKPVSGNAVSQDMGNDWLGC